MQVFKYFKDDFISILFIFNMIARLVRLKLAVLIIYLQLYNKLTVPSASISSTATLNSASV